MAMPWPRTGVTHCHVYLGPSDKGRAIKGFIVCNSFDVSVFGPTTWSGPTLLTVPRSINRICLDRGQ